MTCDVYFLFVDEIVNIFSLSCSHPKVLYRRTAVAAGAPAWICEDRTAVKHKHTRSVIERHAVFHEDEHNPSLTARVRMHKRARSRGVSRDRARSPRRPKTSLRG